MTPDQLRETGEALYGPRWQSDMARDLNVHRDTVRSWARGRTAVSASVAAELHGLVQARLATLQRVLA